jgi:hypothetical protein
MDYVSKNYIPKAVVLIARSDFYQHPVTCIILATSYPLKAQRGRSQKKSTPVGSEKY